MKTKSLLARVDTCLVACAAVATAVAPSTSEAAIVYSGAVFINIPSNVDGVYLNVVTGVTGTSSGTVPGWDINPFSATSLSLFTSTGAGGNGVGLGGGAYVGTGANYFVLPNATVISAASSFGNVGTNTPAAATPLNLNSADNLIGFRFVNEATGMINFGWMRLSLAGTPGGQPRAIADYAYENSGGPISGPLFPPPTIPEPSTYALLSVAALGAFGVRAWRQRKTA